MRVTFCRSSRCHADPAVWSRLHRDGPQQMKSNLESGVRVSECCQPRDPALARHGPGSGGSRATTENAAPASVGRRVPARGGPHSTSSAPLGLNVMLPTVGGCPGFLIVFATEYRGRGLRAAGNGGAPVGNSRRRVRTGLRSRRGPQGRSRTSTIFVDQAQRLVEGGRP